MMTETAFASLRMAATLAMAVPTVRVRLSSPDRELLEVSWLPGDLPAGVVHVPPCGFRRSIACARARRGDGHVAFFGLGPNTDPVVRIVVSPGDRSLPGDIYQVRIEGGWRHVVPSLLSGHRAARLLQDIPLALRFHEDQATGVTLVEARTADRTRPVGDALLAARSRLVVEELLDELATSSRS